jgi:dTDP-4-amino-4,6-dideoxygalactose transaminase
MGPGDEFILPSFTFSSTANCFALRGSIPIFVDVRKDTLNLDEQLVEAAITSKTKAIIVVHYAGVSCEMDIILKIAAKYGLIVIEDAAQAIGSTYKNKPLGTIGNFGAVSFHNTKNIQCGEGGLIILQDAVYDSDCSTIINKGTNYRELVEGKVKTYHWQSLGSSYTLSDLQVAYLCAQLKSATLITSLRKNIWDKYHKFLLPAENVGLLNRPFIPKNCTSNGHLYYVLLRKEINRGIILDRLLARGIQAVTHYEPLHLTSIGKKTGRTQEHLPVTSDAASRLIRLPLWPNMTTSQIEFIVSVLVEEINLI